MRRLTTPSEFRNAEKCKPRLANAVAQALSFCASPMVGMVVTISPSLSL